MSLATTASRCISTGWRPIYCNVIGWNYVVTYFNYIVTYFNYGRPYVSFIVTPLSVNYDVERMAVRVTEEGGIIEVQLLLPRETHRFRRTLSHLAPRVKWNYVIIGFKYDVEVHCAIGYTQRPRASWTNVSSYPLHTSNLTIRDSIMLQSSNTHAWNVQCVVIFVIFILDKNGSDAECQWGTHCDLMLSYASYYGKL